MKEMIKERIDRRCKMSLVSDVVKASRRKEGRLRRAIFRQPALPQELALALAPELALCQYYHSEVSTSDCTTTRTCTSRSTSHITSAVQFYHARTVLCLHPDACNIQAAPHFLHLQPAPRTLSCPSAALTPPSRLAPWHYQPSERPQRAIRNLPLRAFAMSINSWVSIHQIQLC